MQCILNYPTEDQNANLGMILDLKHKFPNAVPGYSDHTLPKDMEALKIATLLGAVILEKHFTHDKSLPGNDHYHAMDKDDIKHFTCKMDEAYSLGGQQTKKPLKTEGISRQNARRSLVSVGTIKKGEELTKENLTWKRPAHGISPKDIEQVIGRKAIVDIADDTLLQWNMLN